MAKKIDQKVKKSIDEMSDSTKDFKNLAEDMFNSLKTGGAKSKAVFKELGKMFTGLTDSSSNAVKSIKGIGVSAKSAATSIEDMSNQQEQFIEIQKTLAGYDGPRLKTSGLISKDLTNQLSYSNLLQTSKENLSKLDGNQTIIEKKLTRIAEQRLKSQSDLNAAQLLYERASSKLDKLKTDEIEKHKQVVKLQEKLQKISDPKERNDLQAKLNKAKEEEEEISKRVHSAEASTEDLEKNLLADIKQRNDELQDRETLLSSINDFTKDITSEQSKLATASKDVEASAYNVGSSLFRQEDYTSNIAETMQRTREMEAERAKILSGNTSLTAKQREDALQVLESNIAINTEQVKTYTALQKSAEAYDKINSKAIAMRDTIMTPVDKLFGIVPSGISKMLGLDTFQSIMKEKVGTAIGTAFTQSSTGITGFFSAASAGASTLMTSLLPILPILLAIAGVVGLVKLFTSADKAVGQLSKDLNISYQQSVLVKEQAVQIASEFGNLGVKSDDVTKSMIELSKAMGMNVALMAQHNDKAKALVETTTTLNKLYGISTEDTLALNNAAALVDESVDGLAAKAALFGNELVPAQELIQEIGKVSKGVLMNFKGNTQALLKSVMQAKLLGTTLDKLNSAGAKMMDFESSIAAQNKARVLLGKNINTDAIRFYYITGQQEKMQEAIVQQMGSAQEYMEKSTFQRQIQAEALGFQREEMDEMMAAQLKLEKMGVKEADLAEMLKNVKEGTLSDAQALARVNQGEGQTILKTMLREQKRASILERMTNAWEKIQDILYIIVEPLLGKMDKWVESLGDGQQYAEELSKKFKKWGEYLVIAFDVSKALVQGVWMILGPVLKGILHTFEWIQEKIFGIKQGSDETGKSMDGILSLVKGIGMGLASWYIGKKVFSGAKSLYETFSSIKDKISGKEKSESVSTPEVDTKDAEKLDKPKFGGFKESMRNLADGLKAMGEDGVGKGILNMLAAGPALLIAIPAIPMILFMGKTKLDNLFNNFYNLASGLTAMAEIKEGGLKNTAAAGLALIPALGSIPFIYTFNKMDTGKLKENFTNLSAGLNVMADIKDNSFKNIALSGATLLAGLLGLPFIFAFNAIDTSKLITNFTNLAAGIKEMDKVTKAGLINIGASGVALLLGLAGLPFIMAFNAIDTSKLITNFTNLAGGLDAMSSGIAGVGVLAAFAVAAILAIPSLVFLGGIALLGAAGAAGMVALGGGLEALGAVAATGLPFVAVGLIAALGVAMIPFAAALLIAAPALKIFADMVVGVFGKLPPIIDALANGVAKIIDTIGSNVTRIISTVTDSVAKLGEINPLKLIGVGYGLAAIGAGLLALTAGEVVNGIASFFGADPIDTLKELENINGEKLKLTGDGLLGMSNALSKLSNLDADPIIKINESIKPISDIDNDSIAVTAVAISDLALAFNKLNEALNKLPADAAKKIKDITDAAAKSTNNQFSDLPGSILTGLQSIKNKVATAIKSPFEDAFDYLDDIWLGHSPSEIGSQMQIGIASVQPKISKSITSTFKKLRNKPSIKYFIGGATRTSKFGKNIYDGVDSAINPALSNSFNDTLSSFAKPASLDDFKSIYGKSQSVQSQEHEASINALRRELLGVTPANDLISEPTKKAGYGNRVLLSPEGTFSFNNQDSIIAGTDLFSNKKQNQQFPSGIKVNDFISMPYDPVYEANKQRYIASFKAGTLTAMDKRNYEGQFPKLLSDPDIKNLTALSQAGPTINKSIALDSAKKQAEINNRMYNAVHPEFRNLFNKDYVLPENAQYVEPTSGVNPWDKKAKTLEDIKNIAKMFSESDAAASQSDKYKGYEYRKANDNTGIKIDWAEAAKLAADRVDPNYQVPGHVKGMDIISPAEYTGTDNFTSDFFKLKTQDINQQIPLKPGFQTTPDWHTPLNAPAMSINRPIAPDTYDYSLIKQDQLKEQATPGWFERHIRSTLPFGWGNRIYDNPAENAKSLTPEQKALKAGARYDGGVANAFKKVNDFTSIDNTIKTLPKGKISIQNKGMATGLNPIDPMAMLKNKQAPTVAINRTLPKQESKQEEKPWLKSLTKKGIEGILGPIAGHNINDTIFGGEEEEKKDNTLQSIKEYREQSERVMQVAEKMHTPAADVLKKFNPFHQIEHGAVSLWESLEKHGIGGTLSKGWGTLKTIGKPAVKAGTEAPKGGFWSGLMESGSSMLSKGWEGIKGAGTGILETGANVLSKGKKGITNIGKSLSESGIGGTLSKGWKGLKEGGAGMLSKGWEGIKGGIGGIGTSLGTSWLEGGGALLKGIEAGGVKGLVSTAGVGLKKFATKGNVVGAIVGGLIDTGINMAEGKDWKESLARAAISGVSSFAGGALGSLLLPGAGTVAGGVAGSMLGDKLGDWLFDKKNPERGKMTENVLAATMIPGAGAQMLASKIGETDTGKSISKPLQQVALDMILPGAGMVSSLFGDKKGESDSGKSIGKSIKNVATQSMLDMILPGAGMFSSISSLFGDKKEADDLFSPGYGERTLTTPEGTYGLNNKDNIVATTNPPVMPIMQQPSTVTVTADQPQQNSSAPAPAATNNNQSLKNVEALLQQLVNQTNQPATIKIGDMAIKEIGTQLHFNQSYNAMINSHRS